MTRLLTVPVCDVDPAAILVWLRSSEAAELPPIGRDLIALLAQALLEERRGAPDELGREDLWTAELTSETPRGEA